MLHDNYENSPSRLARLQVNLYVISHDLCNLMACQTLNKTRENVSIFEVVFYLCVNNSRYTNTF